MLKMKRIKKLEYPWIKWGAFKVGAYTVKHNNGKTYVIYAHSFTDMEDFLLKLEVFGDGIKTYQKDCFDSFETRKLLSFIPDKKGHVKQKPFWWRGRVYEMADMRGEKHEQ